MPKVIFVNRFYAPDQSATARLLTDLAEYLAATGHDVWVITSRLSYEGKHEPWLLRQNQNGVHVVTCRPLPASTPSSSSLDRTAL